MFRFEPVAAADSSSSCIIGIGGAAGLAYDGCKKTGTGYCMGAGCWLARGKRQSLPQPPIARPSRSESEQRAELLQPVYCDGILSLGKLRMRACTEVAVPSNQGHGLMPARKANPVQPFAGGCIAIALQMLCCEAALCKPMSPCSHHLRCCHLYTVADRDHCPPWMSLAPSLKQETLCI